MTIAATGPNAEQIEYWNSPSAAKWVALQDRIDATIEPFGVLAMDRAELAAGERAIDVGCGCGTTTLALAERVGPRGRVLGVDISAVMLARASERARSAGIANMEFANADAQTHAFVAAAWDSAYSRFGVMFFAEPARAFANLRGALRRGGRVSFVCWRPFPENPWMTVPFAALATFLTPPPPPPPGAPGPFAFGDPERVRGILEDAGFAQIEIAPHDGELTLGRSLDDAVTFTLSAGPAARLLDPATPADRERAAIAVRDALAPHVRGGVVALAGAIWLVRARNPG
ncbi:MAG: class I SAM-dependent methyltransferase [Deltaproteobacteria bacterium]|nr:MAG: class I SAM-dependent methyltransferase [Deltaproteobacteria bacterium]